MIVYHEPPARLAFVFHGLLNELGSLRTEHALSLFEDTKSPLVIVLLLDILDVDRRRWLPIHVSIN